MTPSVPQFLSFATIAPLLGMAEPHVFPTEERCLHCDAMTLMVGIDNSGHFEWYYCRHCKRTGTVLAMAADKWQVSEAEAAERLRVSADPEKGRDEVAKYFDRQLAREKMLTLWHNTCQQLFQMDTAKRAALRSIQCEMPTNADPEFILSHIAPLVGVAYLRKLFAERIVDENQPANWFEGQLAASCLSRSTGNPRLQVGIILPFYCLPVASTPSQLKLWRDGVQLELPSNASSPPLRLQRDRAGVEPRPATLGLLGLPLLQFNHESFVVLTSMHRLLLELHFRHYRTSVTPLPLLGWQSRFPDVTPTMWPFLQGRDIIIWEKTLSSSTLQLAANFGAKLTIGDIVLQGNNITAADIVAAVRRQASPWEDVLARQLKSLEASDREVLLSAIEGTKCEQLKEAVRKLTPAKKSAVLQSFIIHPLTRRTNFKSVGPEVWTYQNNMLRDGANKLRLIGRFQLTGMAIKPPRKDHAHLGKKHVAYIGYFVINEHKVPFWYPSELEGYDRYTTARREAQAALMTACVQMLPRELSDQVVPLLRHLKVSIVQLAKKFCLQTLQTACVEDIGWTGYRFNFRGGEFTSQGFRLQHPFLTAKSTGPSFLEYKPKAAVNSLLRKSTDDAVFAWVVGFLIARHMLQHIRRELPTKPCLVLDPSQYAIAATLRNEWFGLLDFRSKGHSKSSGYPLVTAAVMDTPTKITPAVICDAVVRAFQWQIRSTDAFVALRAEVGEVAERVKTILAPFY